MELPQDAQAWGFAASVLTFATLVVTKIIELIKQSSQRKADLADRKAARQSLEDKLEEARFEQLRMILDQYRIILAKLVEGITAAKLAYHEANDVNLKLASLRTDLNKTLESVPKIVVTPVVVQPHPPRATDPPALPPAEDAEV